MKKLVSALIFAALASASAVVGQQQTGVVGRALAPEAPTAPFTYQGKLVVNASPANGSFDFKIYLCKEPDATNEPADRCLDSRSFENVTVAGGIFTLHPDFAADSFYDGGSRYLDIQVRSTTDGGEYTQLSPRQPVEFTPFAIRSTLADSSNWLSCTNCVTDGQIVSISGAKVSGKVASAANADSAVNISGVVGINHGGTGSMTQNFVDLTTNQSVAGNKTFTGTISGNGAGLISVPGTLKWNVSSGGNVQMQSNNGYVLTNTSAVTITLPATPAVGDVIRVMAKGTGGFTVAMNQGQSILDWATTHQETSWTRQYNVASSASSAYWVGIASSDDGTKLAAVESPGILAISSNSGSQWTAPMPDDIRNYTCIASSSDGTKLIAGVAGGYLYTSADSGATWTARYADANRNWYSVASSADGMKLVAADNRSVFTSTDSGVSWTARMSPNTISHVASSADGTKLIAAVLNGHVYTSTTSGVLWTDRISSTFNQWQSVASSSDGSKLVAVESPGKVWVSSNFGVAWTSFTLGPSGINTSWNTASVSSDGTRIAVSAGGVVSGPGGLVVISYDGGTTWTPTGIGTVWSAVAVAGNGTRMSAATADNNLNKLYSGPVQTITVVDTITGIKDSAAELVYIGNNQFAMVSSNGMTISPHIY